MKAISIVAIAVLLGGCAHSDSPPRRDLAPTSRSESLRDLLARHRVVTLGEIMELPVDTTTNELFDVFGRNIEAPMAIGIFFVLPREAHAQSTDDKFRYGFYVWPASVVSEYSDNIPIRFISWNPEGVVFGEDEDLNWMKDQIILWPPSLAGQKHPGLIPSIEGHKEK